MRKISILVFAAVFIAALSGCGVKDAESVAKEKVSVYDTTQYQDYRRLYNFVVTSMPEQLHKWDYIQLMLILPWTV